MMVLLPPPYSPGPAAPADATAHGGDAESRSQRAGRRPLRLYKRHDKSIYFTVCRIELFGYLCRGLQTAPASRGRPLGQPRAGGADAPHGRKAKSHPRENAGTWPRPSAISPRKNV